jgi:flagellar basal body-associated protein FliL
VAAEDTDIILDDPTAISMGSEKSGGRMMRIAAIALAILVLAGAGAYWFMGSSWISGQENPALPQRADVPTPAAAPKHAAPTDAELEAYFREVIRLLNSGGIGNDAPQSLR